MANLNKVMLIGRLTRDPQTRTFTNGGKVADIGFAVNNRRKNQTTGEWEETPCWLDLKAFNRESGRKLADLAEQYLRKGHQVFIEGHLVLEEWLAKDDGKKRQKLVVWVDDFRFLEKKKEDEAGPGAQKPSRAARELEEVPF